MKLADFGAAQARLARNPTPGSYARELLNALGHESVPLPVSDVRDAAALWADSGAMWLTGHSGDEPRHCRAPLAACAQGAWLALAALCPRLDPAFDAYRMLGERAAIAGLSRHGRISPGGACRLLPTSDGWLALNLAREADTELLPAWLQCPIDGDESLTASVRQATTHTLVDRARLIGLAAAPLVRPRDSSSGWYRATRSAPAVGLRHASPLVIELGALWAAPLCAQLLLQAGARVIKVESLARPDGARGGPPQFYDLLNAEKESVALDLPCAAGVAALRELLLAADIVIESSRPRALEQMGLHAAEIVAARPGMVWLGISGYGRRAPMRNWIAYGDDAGVAAGLSWLVGDRNRDPVFCGDAIADPLTGLHAALLAWSVWCSGGGQLLDVSLRGVVAHAIASGPAAVPLGNSPRPREPFARPVAQRAAALGEHSERVLREFKRRSG